MSYFLKGDESLGIELGSTRIKAVLTNASFAVIAAGSYEWESRFENGIWTYSESDIIKGVRGAYLSLCENVAAKYGEKIKKLGSVGVSAMMHGYMPFDSAGRLLVPFRTWRNTITAHAAGRLTELFNFNIPQRWSIAHLYRAILNDEEHIQNISSITTLSGYVHRLLSGRNVLGVGDASGMFPIDSKTGSYDKKMLKKFSSLDELKKCKWNIEDILPQLLKAGDCAGFLTADGAALLDPDGELEPGAVMCPPEGDAGTGMVAADSVRANTGNVSAGTSIFLMAVLEKPLENIYEEIDMVTTPSGRPVAMVHCNNCCTDLDYWVSLFTQAMSLAGAGLSKAEAYNLLYNTALNADSDGGGLVSYNYISGEPVTGLSGGRPLFLRSENCSFNLPNFMRTQLYSTMAALKIGMEILDKEKIRLTHLVGHGGLFKTKYVAQQLLAGALNTPVTVMDTAGEGGAWGIAVLSRFTLDGGGCLEDYLEKRVFADCKGTTVSPDEKDKTGFEKYMKLYKKGLPVEKAAADIF